MFLNSVAVADQRLGRLMECFRSTHIQLYRMSAAFTVLAAIVQGRKDLQWTFTEKKPSHPLGCFPPPTVVMINSMRCLECSCLGISVRCVRTIQRQEVCQQTSIVAADERRLREDNQMFEGRSSRWCVCVQLLLWDVRLTVWLLLWEHSLPGKCHEIASSDFTEQTDSEIIVSDVSPHTTELLVDAFLLTEL